ncbi:MAG: hypothetical protein JXR76_15120 [Deltaproteobacteria bacterium]|nr:hypothetical protein [Deltaproteobacteria bacterium]
MDKITHLKLERNYLIASAVAVFAAFLCINIYPEHHGGPQIGQSGLLALSAAMIAMMVYIVRKAITDKSESANADGTDDNSEPVSDPRRLKRMFFLWSACTVVLSISLVRYPLYLQYRMNESIDGRGVFSLIMGAALIIGTLIHIIARLKDYKKL